MTKNPHEIARIERRNAMVAETALAVEQALPAYQALITENKTLWDHNAALDADNDRLRDQIQSLNQEYGRVIGELEANKVVLVSRNEQLNTENSGLRAELQRLQNQPENAP